MIGPAIPRSETELPAGPKPLVPGLLVNKEGGKHKKALKQNQVEVASLGVIYLLSFRTSS